MSDRPNILLITTDQQRFDAIHHAGNDRIFTPHLNWLIGSGIHFTRCYSDAPVCVPARATLMTGRHGWSNGLTTNGSKVVPQAEHPTLPGELTRAGYQTRAVGKMHFHPVRAHYGFEHMELPMDYHRQMQRRGHVSRPKSHGIGENEMEPVFSTVEEDLSLTRWLVDRSIDFVETRDPTRPFFCWTSFPKPHPPFDCDIKYWQLYDRIEMAPPVTGDWSAEVADVPGALMSSTWTLNQSHRFAPHQLEAAKRAYHACITQIDYNLGCLFARLREMNLLENTWIIFTADHGELMGDHHLSAKGAFFEGSAHVPMIVRPPARDWAPRDLQGERCDELVCLADVMPTILRRAGVDVPAGCDGHDLLDIHAGRERRDHLHHHCGDLFGVIEREGWKYHYCARGNAELLFDLSDDPYEQRERIRAGDAVEHYDRLRGRMLEHLREHAPQAVDGDELVGTGPDPVEDDHAGRLWPGFHSTSVESDVLH